MSPAPQSLQLCGSDYRFLTDIFNDLVLQLSQTDEHFLKVANFAELGNFDKSGVFLKYPIQSLKSIIIGEKMPLAQRQTLYNIIRLKSKDISIKIAARIPGKFGVVINDFTE